MSRLIDTDNWSALWRKAGIDLPSRRLLVTNFSGTEQETDMTEPPNCRGFGRIRHFRRATSPGWPPNPIPIDPISRAMGLPTTQMARAQVFQNAVCNWRCWYCFVPFDLLSANLKHAEWFTPDELVDLYLLQDDPPVTIDLTGGQPDLVPEWIPWMMQAIRVRHLEGKVYLWSDDNLSTDYFWRFLSEQEIELTSSFQNYGRVCCFKGFDEESFSFNTLAAPQLYHRQFELFRRFIDLGLDLYAYVTLTTPNASDISDKMASFVDKLQDVHENLPLRTVPLQVHVFTPVERRMDPPKTEALQNQEIAVQAWSQELERRYPARLRGENITGISLKAR